MAMAVFLMRPCYYNQSRWSKSYCSLSQYRFFQ